jgi:hypothetical protein
MAARPMLRLRAAQYVCAIRLESDADIKGGLDRNKTAVVGFAKLACRR